MKNFLGIVFFFACYIALFLYLSLPPAPPSHLKNGPQESIITAGSFYGFDIGMSKESALKRIRKLGNNLYLTYADSYDKNRQPVLNNGEDYVSFSPVDRGTGKYAFDQAKEERSIKELTILDTWLIKMVYVDFPDASAPYKINELNTYSVAPSSDIPFNLMTYPELQLLVHDKKIAIYCDFILYFNTGRLVNVTQNKPSISLLDGFNGYPKDQIYP